MSDDTIVGEYSMSLRDYIAIETMKIILQRGVRVESEEVFAKGCYAMADAMLAAREAQ